MENQFQSNQFQRYVNIAYLVLAGLVYFLLLVGLQKLSATYDFESKVKSIDLVIRGLSIAVGLGLFVGLYRHPKANEFMNEVASELLTKVTWPTSKDTMSATVVVIITVIIAGIVLAFFDWLFTIGLQGLWSLLQRVFL